MSSFTNFVNRYGFPGNTERDVIDFVTTSLFDFQKRNTEDNLTDEEYAKQSREEYDLRERMPNYEANGILNANDNIFKTTDFIIDKSYDLKDVGEIASTLLISVIMCSDPVLAEVVEAVDYMEENYQLKQNDMELLSDVKAFIQGLGTGFSVTPDYGSWMDVGSIRLVKELKHTPSNMPLQFAEVLIAGPSVVKHLPGYWETQIKAFVNCPVKHKNLFTEMFDDIFNKKSVTRDNEVFQSMCRYLAGAMLQTDYADTDVTRRIADGLQYFPLLCSGDFSDAFILQILHNLNIPEDNVMWIFKEGINNRCTK